MNENNEINKNEDTTEIPHLHIGVEKELKNMTLILESTVEQQKVKEVSVWAEDTGRVKDVIWLGLNRWNVQKSLLAWRIGIVDKQILSQCK